MYNSSVLLVSNGEISCDLIRACFDALHMNFTIYCIALLIYILILYRTAYTSKSLQNTIGTVDVKNGTVDVKKTFTKSFTEHLFNHLSSDKET